MKQLEELNLLQVNGGSDMTNNPRHKCPDGASGTLIFIGADHTGDLYQCLHCGATGHLSDLSL